MPRVVCPLCRTGFDANISRDNFALNCVSCGVAFNAAAYLSKEDFSARAERRPNQKGAPAHERGTVALGNVIRPVTPPPVPAFVEPVSHSTRTGGLPFMAEQGEPATKPAIKKHETSLPVIPPRVEAKAEVKPDTVEKAEPKIVIERSADECPVPLAPVAEKKPVAPPVEKSEPAPVVVPAKAAEPKAEVLVVVPTPPSAAPVSMAQPEPEAKKPEAKVKKSRRPLLEGSFGPYEIEGEIARGGVGAVFRARERDGGRAVALKVLLEGEEAGESERERFRHECETAKALSLPGMVQVYAVGEIEQKPYMAMELVEGRSLDKIIPEKKLSVNDCLVLMKSVAETIGALHEAGYVHRDLKPGNILIDAFGSPKVADFGLVKSLDEITRLTASGLVCGTPAYMAPEQARGDGKAVDPRSDVWALGAVLYEMLACQAPFQAENALRLMLKITKDQPKALRAMNLKVPQDVQFIVMKCLEKNPEKRYATARAMSADIGRFLNGEPLEIRQPPKMQQLLAAASENRRRLVAIGAGVAAVVVVGVIARFVFAPREANPIVDRGYRSLYERSFDQAETQFREAIALDAKNARAWLGLGLVLGRTGIQQQQITNQRRVDEAMSATAKAAELDPKLRSECHAQVANFNRWKGDSVTAAQELELAVELSPGSLKYREALGMAYWHAGVQSQSSTLYKKAVVEFQTILSADPTYPKVRDYVRQLQEQFLAQQTPSQRGGTVARARTRN